MTLQPVHQVAAMSRSRWSSLVHRAWSTGSAQRGLPPRDAMVIKAVLSLWLRWSCWHHLMSTLAPLHQTGLVERVAAVFAMAGAGEEFIWCKPLADNLRVGPRCPDGFECSSGGSRVSFPSISLLTIPPSPSIPPFPVFPAFKVEREESDNSKTTQESEEPDLLLTTSYHLRTDGLPWCCLAE